MTWIQRYRFRNFIRTSAWIVPAGWAVLAIVLHKLVWKFDLWARWELLGHTQEGARALVGSISSSMLTFIVFLLTMIFIAIQISVAQLTPRIIVYVFRERVVKMALGFFIFTYLFSVSVQGKIGDPMPQLAVMLTVVFTLVSIGIFVYLVGYIGKALRPLSIFANAAVQGIHAIETIYPVQLPKSGDTAPAENLSAEAKQSTTIRYRGKSGHFMAFDVKGLVKLASRVGGTIRIIPEVGDFITTGDPLFQVNQGNGTVDEQELHQSVAIGPERTIEQDPAFAFRIIVDIAIKALSPAINDPTTAVSGIDQIHRLLRVLAARDLGDGRVRDRAGRLCVVFPTPDWEDFVQLGVTEIRQYGAGSIQVVRRLRAMLENLTEAVPPNRRPVLREQLNLLDRTVENHFPEPDEQALGKMADYQGIGGSPSSHRENAEGKA